MRKLPPLSAVRVFEAAARHQNFTKAAMELGMTQAAVSYQIRILEERLGHPLFVRANKRASLTDAGRKAAPAVSAGFDTIADAFASLVTESESVLTISTAQTFASNWLAPRLGAFQVGRPDLAVRLLTSDRLVDFASEEVDLAIRAGPGKWPGLRAHFLFRSHYTPLCSPGFRDRHRLEEPCDVLGVARLSPDDIWWKLWLEQAGLDAEHRSPTPGIRLDSQVMEGNAALAGHGLAILTPLFWQGDLRSGRLVQPFAQMGLYSASYWLVYPEHKRAQPKIRAFREWLLSEIAADAAAGPDEVYREAVDIS